MDCTSAAEERLRIPMASVTLLVMGKAMIVMRNGVEGPWAVMAAAGNAAMLLFGSGMDLLCSDCPHGLTILK